MEPLTNDQLIQIVEGGMFTEPLISTAKTELLARITGTKSDEMDKIYYQIKDLHGRLDQVCKKLVELEEGKPSLKGSDFKGMPAATQKNDVFLVNTTHDLRLGEKIYRSFTGGEIINWAARPNSQGGLGLNPEFVKDQFPGL